MLAVWTKAGDGEDGLTGEELLAQQVGCVTADCLPQAVAPAVQPPQQAGAGSHLEGELPPPQITGYAAVVLEEPCGYLHYGLNERLSLPPASLTKIMTAVVAAENSDVSEAVTIDISGAELSAATDSTVMGLEPGQTRTVRDLLYGLLLPSGNDAAIALAQHVGGSLQAFVSLMNEKASRLGLSDTRFTNPHGLDDPGLYTSALDIAVLSRALLQHPDLAEIVRTESYQPGWDGEPLQNINLLIGLYPGAIGVKTGYTDNAGQTIVAAAQRDGRRFIVSVLRSQDLFVDASALLDWAFASTEPSCPAAGQPSPALGG